jgi:hypothetical protein
VSVCVLFAVLVVVVCVEELEDDAIGICNSGRIVPRSPKLL